MTSTALGAETKKEEKIIFISDAHEKFYYEKLKEVRYQDVYHKALCYCLGISDDTRRNVYRIYDCNGVQREHNKKLNNGLPILHKVPPKRDYGRYFCILAE